MAGKRELRIEILGDASSANRALHGLQGATGRVSGAFGGMARAAATAVAVIGGAKIFSDIIEQGREAGRVGRITENAIRATGGAANVTAKHVSDLSTAISNKTGIDDEQIQTGQNMILTFKNIRNEVGKGNDIFDQASQAAVDLSIQFGGIDVASKQLGKALNDPIKGIAALSRAGVTFTDQQKDQIKWLVKSGDVLAAQKIILGEVQSQVGGAAAAATDPMQKLGVVVKNLEETIGVALMPALNTASDFLADNLPGALSTGSAAFSDLGAKVGPIMDGIKQVVSTVVTAIGAFWDDHKVKIEAVLTSVGALFSSFWGALKAEFEVFRAVATAIWERLGNTFLQKLSTAFDAITQMLSGAFTILGGVFDLIKALLTGKWGDAWDAIVKILGGAWDLIVGAVKLGIDALSAVLETIKAVVSYAWSEAIGFLENLGSSILSALGDLGSLLYEKGKDLIKGMLRGIRDQATDLPGAIRDAVSGSGGGGTIHLPHLPGLASGGVVRASGGGTIVRLGEGGEDEAVIPMSKMRGSRGGTTVNVTIHAPHYIGDQRQFKTLIQNAVNDLARGNVSAFGTVGVLA